MKENTILLILAGAVLATIVLSIATGFAHRCSGFCWPEVGSVSQPVSWV